MINLREELHLFDLVPLNDFLCILSFTSPLFQIIPPLFIITTIAIFHTSSTVKYTAFSVIIAIQVAQFYYGN